MSFGKLLVCVAIFLCSDPIVVTPTPKVGAIRVVETIKKTINYSRGNSPVADTVHMTRSKSSSATQVMLANSPFFKLGESCGYVIVCTWSN